MIYKHTALLVGLITCIATVSCTAEKNPVAATVPEKAQPAAPVSSTAGKLGDLAPALTVKEWIKGKPVDFKAGTNIYVLVFCTLSRANDFALTNLDNLQKQYADKGVVVVAISAEPAESLKEFVQIKAAKVGFTVAGDDESRTATTSYQQAFKQMMLPRAYIVGKDGKVLWMGHPLRDDMGMVVDEITSGRYNLEQAQKKVIASEQMEQYLALARQDDPRTAKVGRIMLTLRTNDAPALCDLAFQIATAPYIEKRDVAVANAALDRAAQLTTTNATDIAVDRAILLFQTGKQQEGLAQARQALTVALSEADKSEVKTCIHAMEARLAADKASQTNDSSTNSPAGKP
jgi:peroxiredoxin